MLPASRSRSSVRRHFYAGELARDRHVNTRHSKNGTERGIRGPVLGHKNHDGSFTQMTL